MSSICQKFLFAGERFDRPLDAVRDERGKRWIATAWEHCVRKWGRDLCPCMHSDPQFPDCPPGKRVTLHGKIFFLEGPIEEQYERLNKEGRTLSKP